MGARLPGDSFGGSAGRSETRSGRRADTANGTPGGANYIVNNSEYASDERGA